MEKKNIVCVVYNGANRPHSVWLDRKREYDFFYKNGWIQCEWASSGIGPYIFELVDRCKGKRKIWFNTAFRPTDGSLDSTILSDAQIVALGYEIIPEPKHIDSIIYALNSY